MPLREGPCAELRPLGLLLFDVVCYLFLFNFLYISCSRSFFARGAAPLGCKMQDFAIEAGWHGQGGEGGVAAPPVVAGGSQHEREHNEKLAEDRTFITRARVAWVVTMIATRAANLQPHMMFGAAPINKEVSQLYVKESSATALSHQYHCTILVSNNLLRKL